MTGELNPSNELMDLASGMAELNTVSYIPWERCTSRSQELDRPAGQAHKQLWKPDAQGYLKETKMAPELTTHVGGSHLAIKLQEALTRRALALDMIGIMSYEHGHQITQYLMKRFLAEPPTEHHQSPTLEQVRRADTQIWKSLAQSCRLGIKRDVHDRLPLEENVGDALKDFDLALIIQPLAKKGENKNKDRRAEPGVPNDAPTSKAQRRQKQKLAFDKARKERDEAVERANRAEAAQRRPAAVAARPSDDIPRAGRMPRELIGMCSRTVDGKPICYSYNMGVCRGPAAPALRCPKGRHVCCESIGGQACGKPHAALPKRSAAEH